MSKILMEKIRDKRREIERNYSRCDKEWWERGFVPIWNYILDIQEDIMASLDDLGTKIDGVSQKVTEELGKVQPTLQSAIDAINKLRQEIEVLKAQLATGPDTQPLIDKLSALDQPLSDTITLLDNSKAQFDVEGQ